VCSYAVGGSPGDYFMDPRAGRLRPKNYQLNSSVMAAWIKKILPQGASREGYFGWFPRQAFFLLNFLGPTHYGEHFNRKSSVRETHIECELASDICEALGKPEILLPILAFDFSRFSFPHLKFSCSPKITSAEMSPYPFLSTPFPQKADAGVIAT
jgi:hypothetical protein